MDNQEIETKTKDILIDTTESVPFTWTPTQEKDYTIKIKTNIDDCQCSSTSEEYSSAQTIVASPAPAVYLCSDSIDNDADNKIDLSDPGCSSAEDNDETDTAECSQTTPQCPPNAED